MGNKKATGFLCLRLVPCFAYVGAEDNRKGIPFVKIVSLLCKLIQFLMVALSVTVHKALILLVFLNHPYQSLAFARLSEDFIKRLQPLMSGYEIVWFKSEFDKLIQLLKLPLAVLNNR